jgi:hypothetical protein
MIRINIDTNAVDYNVSDFVLVSNTKTAVNVLKNTPVTSKIVNYINRIIASKKPDQFKNFIKPIGEMAFLQKLSLTDVFYDEDIKFLKELESIDDSQLSESQIVCLKLQLDVLYQKIVYYKSFFIVINDDKSNSVIEQIKKQIDAEYNDIKNKDSKTKKIEQDLNILSADFVVKNVIDVKSSESKTSVLLDYANKNIQDTTKDGDELRPLHEKKTQFEKVLTPAQEAMFKAING